jgi:hypothetical protein
MNLLKNEENIQGLFWKVILQFPNNLTCKISVLVSTFCTSVIKLKNSDGNAAITLFTPKVDLEK